jgi:hypothetical protein
MLAPAQRGFAFCREYLYLRAFGAARRLDFRGRTSSVPRELSTHSDAVVVMDARQRGGAHPQHQHGHLGYDRHLSGRHGHPRFCRVQQQRVLDAGPLRTTLGQLAPVFQRRRARLLSGPCSAPARPDSLGEQDRGADPRLEDGIGLGAVRSRAGDLQRPGEEPQEGRRVGAPHRLALP